MPDKNKWIRKFFVILVPLLWIGALFLNAYFVPANNLNSNPGGIQGFWCFLFGWAGQASNSSLGSPVGEILAFIAWLANIPFWIAYFIFVFSKNSPGKVSTFFALLAFLISLCALTVNDVILTEAGHRGYVYPYIGAYVWIISMLLLLIGHFIVKPREESIIH